MQPAARSVRAVNRLTARWAAGGGAAPEGAALSAATLWPLLGFLASAADGPARDELEDAVGLPAAEAAGAARCFIEALGSLRGTRTALGLWTRAGFPLDAAWTAGLPAGTHGTFLGDQAADRERLDAWVAEATGGLVSDMPVRIEKDTELVLAAAQTLRTRWLRPFVETVVECDTGPWRGRALRGLCRTTSVLDRVAVADTLDGPLTVLKVLGTTDVDVHLCMGADGMPPDRVLCHGIGTLTGAGSPVPGDRLADGAPGPGVLVYTQRRQTPEPELQVLTVPFRVEARHDLLRRPAPFGLSTASDPSRGHFPGIGPEPLAVGTAGHTALAVFDAEGFEAASVTALGAVAGGAPRPPRYSVRVVEVTFDRPFAFLAVHRTSRLVLSAGWVVDPLPFTGFGEHGDDSWDEDDH